jgi:site-specific DNA recombinase
VIEDFVLGPLRDRLMHPDAVKAFVAAYYAEINAVRDATAANRTRAVREIDRRRQKLEGIYDAIGDGLRTPGLLAKVEALEAEIAELEAALTAPPSSAARLHPNLAEVYREKVSTLRDTVSNPIVHDEAINVLRKMIERVEVRPSELDGSIQVVGAVRAVECHPVRHASSAATCHPRVAETASCP